MSCLMQNMTAGPEGGPGQVDLAEHPGPVGPTIDWGKWGAIFTAIGVVVAIVIFCIERKYGRRVIAFIKSKFKCEVCESLCDVSCLRSLHHHQQGWTQFLRCLEYFSAGHKTLL